jgi:DNA polymerase zeta
LAPLTLHEANTRGNLLPNPEEDSITCVFWCIQTPKYTSIISENPPRFKTLAALTFRLQSGIIMVKDDSDISHIRFSNEVTIDEEESELDLINRLTDIVREFDPDVLAGYELQSSSWGYVIERARMHFGESPTP